MAFFHAAALLWGFSSSHIHSINLFAAHMMTYLMKNYDVKWDVYDYERDDEECPPLTEIFGRYEEENEFPIPSFQRIDDISAISETFTARLAANYDVVFVNLFPWAEAIRRLKGIHPATRVVYYSHSLLRFENVINGGIRSKNFDHNLACQETLISLADTILFPSYLEKACGQRLYGLDEKETKTGVIYPLPFMRASNRRPTGKDREKTGAAFVYIGRCVYQKGLDSLIEAFFQYWVEHDGSGTMTFVSETADSNQVMEILPRTETRQKLTFLIDRQAFNFIPWQNTREAYLGLLDQLKYERRILIAASFYEPFAIVAYEAVTRGLPVILSRFCGVVELLPPKAPLYRLVNPYSPGEITGAMEELVSVVHSGPAEPVPLGVTPEMSYDAIAQIFGAC
jgi:glycosyltransferase involved in cell wall biosynthesis